MTFIYKVYQDGHRTKNTQQMARITTHSGTTKRVVSHKTHAQSVYFVYNCVSAPNNYLISLPSEDGGLTLFALWKDDKFWESIPSPLPFTLTIPSRSVATRRDPGQDSFSLNIPNILPFKIRITRALPPSTTTHKISFRFPRFLFRWGGRTCYPLTPDLPKMLNLENVLLRGASRRPKHDNPRTALLCQTSLK